MEQEITGTLENWSRYEGLALCLRGNLYEDSKERWQEGTFIRTSMLAPQDQELYEGAIITTRNSIYKLGKPLEITK